MVGVLRGTLWGELVGIRYLRPGDAPTLRRMMMDPEVAHLLFEEIAGPPPSALMMGLAIAMGRLAGRPEFAIVERSGRLIGAVRLWRISPRNRSAMLTIFIGDKSRWGKGYGTDALRLVLRHAFGPMELHRVELHVFDFNHRAIRSYEKAGFVQEGTRRQALFRDGRYHDILVMGVLREEFLAREIERRSDAVARVLAAQEND